MLRADCAVVLAEVRAALPSIVLAADDGRGHELTDVRVFASGTLLAVTLDGRAVPAAIDAMASRDGSVCVHAAAPERPTSPDGVNVPGIVLAFDGVRFDREEQDGGPPKPQSIDLDHPCTCPERNLEPESCVPPDAGGTKRPCDGLDGRDNAAGPLLAAAASLGTGTDRRRWSSSSRAAPSTSS